MGINLLAVSQSLSAAIVHCISSLFSYIVYNNILLEVMQKIFCSQGEHGCACVISQLKSIRVSQSLSAAIVHCISSLFSCIIVYNNILLEVIQKNILLATGRTFGKISSLSPMP